MTGKGERDRKRSVDPARGSSSVVPDTRVAINEI